MVQLVTHKQDGDTNPKQNVGLGIQARIQFHKSTETKGKRDGGSGYTSAPEQKGAERRDETTWPQVSQHPTGGNVLESLRFPF